MLLYRPRAAPQKRLPGRGERKLTNGKKPDFWEEPGF